MKLGDRYLKLVFKILALLSGLCFVGGGIIFAAFFYFVVLNSPSTGNLFLLFSGALWLLQNLIWIYIYVCGSTRRKVITKIFYYGFLSLFIDLINLFIPRPESLGLHWAEISKYFGISEQFSAPISFDAWLHIVDPVPSGVQALLLIFLINTFLSIVESKAN